MYTISKEFSFEAAHRLEGLPPGHKCGRLHGHSYKVIVELQCDSVDETGFVFDYGRLSSIKEWIEVNLDHQYLNDVFNFNPTAENLASYLWGEILKFIPDIKIQGSYVSLRSITIKETEKTSARYEP